MPTDQELKDALDRGQQRLEEAFDKILEVVERLEQDVSNSIDAGQLNPIRDVVERYRNAPQEGA